MSCLLSELQMLSAEWNISSLSNILCLPPKWNVLPRRKLLHNLSANTLTDGTEVSLDESKVLTLLTVKINGRRRQKSLLLF